MFFPFTRQIGILGVAILLTFAGSAQAQKLVTSGQPAGVAILDSTREQDGLAGPVRKLRTESAKLELQGDQLIEGQRQLLEVTTYDPRGNRLENVSYPSASSPVGKEEYKYDKGNVVEMTLRSESGGVLSRESYSYEFDRFGNWTKMVTNLLVYEGGALRQEPVEVTYRKLTYYFDDQIAKIVEPSAPEKTAEVPTTTTEPATLQAEPAPSAKSTDSSPISAAAPGTGVASAPELEKPVETLNASTTGPSGPPVAEASSTNGQAETVSALTGDSVALEANRQPSEAVASVETDAAADAVSHVEPLAASKSTPEIPINQNGLEFFKAGRERMDAGDFKGAVAALVHSLELQPNSVEGSLSLGLAYLKLDKNKDALKAFKDAVRLDPNGAEGQYGLGLANFRIGHHRDAAEAFKRATEIQPGMAKAHYGLALAYQELGKNELLLAEFRILQTLDANLARQLAQSFPEANLPCSFKCK